jgi:hypothetical protein
MAAPPRDSNQLKEHAIRMTTHPNDRFWTTVNLEFEHEQDTQWCIFRNRRHSMHAVGT